MRVSLTMLKWFKERLRAWKDSFLVPFQCRMLAWAAHRQGRSLVALMRFEALGDVIWASAAVRYYQSQNLDKQVVFLTQRRHLPVLRHLDCGAPVLALSEGGDSQCVAVVGCFDEVHRMEQVNAEVRRSMFYDYCENLELKFAPHNPVLKKPRPPRQKRLRPVIILHIGPTWAVRSVEKSLVEGVLKGLSCNCDVIQIGKIARENEANIRVEGATCALNTLSLGELFEQIKNADVFLGVDSGPMHIAAACGVPIVGLFSSTLPETRLPFGEDAYGVLSDVDCVGCHHLEPKGHSRETCPQGVVCRQSYRVEAILEALEKALAISLSGS